MINNLLNTYEHILTGCLRQVDNPALPVDTPEYHASLLQGPPPDCVDQLNSASCMEWQAAIESAGLESNITEQWKASPPAWVSNFAMLGGTENNDIFDDDDDGDIMLFAHAQDGGMEWHGRCKKRPTCCNPAIVWLPGVGFCCAHKMMQCWKNPNARV